jgi:hypothetical protein
MPKSEPETFPQPRRKDGELPCGECHLNQGETCDICGAVQPIVSHQNNPLSDVLREALAKPIT